MKKKASVPSYQSIMPHVIYALKDLGGTASNRQVLYKVLLDLDIELSQLKKAKNNINWAGVYLRKLNFLEENSSKGIWVLRTEFMGMDNDLIRDMVKQHYKEYYKL